MKYVQLLFCLFFMNITSHCMELDKRIKRWEDIDYLKSEKNFEERCKKYIQQCLKEYKGNDFVPETMNNIVREGNKKIGRNCIDYIHDARDEQQNGFFQYSIKKGNLPVVQWLIEKGNIQRHSEKECKDFVTLSVEQLSPSQEEKEFLFSEEEKKSELLLKLEDAKKRRDNAYVVFKAIIESYKTYKAFESCKNFYVEEIMKLNLKHKKERTGFMVNEELLIPFLTEDQSLRVVYQTITDEGNTFAHVLVEQHDADELYKFIENDYVLPIVNNDGLNVIDLAFNKHDKITQEPTLFDMHPEESQQISCCYFMLIKYLKLKQNAEDFDKTNDCSCGKHPIIKKYADQLKKSTEKESSLDVSLIEPAKINDADQSSKSIEKNLLPEISPVELKDQAVLGALLLNVFDEQNSSPKEDSNQIVVKKADDPEKSKYARCYSKLLVWLLKSDDSEEMDNILWL